MSEQHEHAASSTRSARPQRRAGAVRRAARAAGGLAGAGRAAQQLVRMHLPLVEHLARRFRNRGEPLDDLTQVATIGLIKSVDRFDPDRGVEFSTYATPTVVGEIKRHFRDKGWAVRVPRRLQELRLVADHGHRRALPAARPRPDGPRAGRAAGHLRGGGPGGAGVGQRLQHAVAGRPGHGRRVPGGRRTPSARRTRRWRASSTASRSSRCWRSCRRGRRRILLLRFFGNMTQSQIAQEVGISQMHVSRLLARTLAQLREKLLVEE